MGAKFDVIVVGSGISGAVLAERYASVLNKKVLVIEKRDHVGGNCFDYINHDGLLVSKYGAHLFHTNYEDVWNYVCKFSRWYPYEHHVLCKVAEKLVPLPINIRTLNVLLSLDLRDGEEMKSWLSSQIVHLSKPKNSEESALSRVGRILYEKLFKYYTKKQWDLWPQELDPSVLERIPVRNNFDDRYFGDKYQFQPSGGFTRLFERMLDHRNITVLLETDYFAVREKFGNFSKLFFTGPIDRYFDNVYEPLQYRSIHFEFTTYDQKYFQENSVINYPNDYSFTRVVEYKHITGQNHPKTTVSREYPSWEGEPYYPVPTPKNRELYDKYRKSAESLESKGIFFVGRLANYKYFNMDQAFKNSLDIFYRLNPLIGR